MKVLFMTILSIGLVGCTGMSSNFQCNVPSGGMCASMSQVNQLVDEEALPGLVHTHTITYVRMNAGNNR
jgi:hypothetical protein